MKARVSGTVNFVLSRYAQQTGEIRIFTPKDTHSTLLQRSPFFQCSESRNISAWPTDWALRLFYSPH